LITVHNLNTGFFVIISMSVRQKKPCKPFFLSSLFIYVLQKDLAQTNLNKKRTQQKHIPFDQINQGILIHRSGESFTPPVASVHGGACHLSTTLVRNRGLGHVDAAPQHELTDNDALPGRAGALRPLRDLVAGTQPEEDVDENVTGQRRPVLRFLLWGKSFK
jgi:hypothetical protein